MFGSDGALTPLLWFFEALSIVAFVVEAFAFVDAIRRPAAAFVAAGKQTKPLWLIILGVATVVGLGYSVLAGSTSAISILPIVAFVAAAIYLTDVRPKVQNFGGGGGSSSSSQHMGPYGPW